MRALQIAVIGAGVLAMAWVAVLFTHLSPLLSALGG